MPGPKSCPELLIKRPCVGSAVPYASEWNGCSARGPSEKSPQSDAELQSRVAYPKHWTNGEHEIHQSKLHRLLLERHRRIKAAASADVNAGSNAT